MKPSFLANPDTNILINHLSKIEPGGTFTHEEGKALITGRDLFGKDSYILQSARRIAVTKHGIVFEAIRGEGIRRLLNDEIPSVAQACIPRIRRIAKRACVKTLCADYEKLSPEAKNAFNAGLSHAGTIAALCTTKAAKALEISVTATGQRLALDDTLKLIRK